MFNRCTCTVEADMWSNTVLSMYVYTIDADVCSTIRRSGEEWGHTDDETQLIGSQIRAGWSEN